MNCLKLQESEIGHMKNFSDGRILLNILRISSNKLTCEVTAEQANEDITFLKMEYPNYCMDAESCEMEDEIEITYVTSVLLYHSVVYCKTVV